MSTTDNAPDSKRDGGGQSYEDYFDKARWMVRVPPLLYEALTDPNDLLEFRRVLKDWFLIYTSESTGQNIDRQVFDELDGFLTSLVQPVLYREFLKSHHIQNDSKQ